MSFPLRFSPVTINMPGGVEVPDIPGCFSAGEDLDNAIAMAREAIEGHLELLAQDQQEIPKASLVSVHAANPAYAGCTWALIDIDITRYLGKAEKLNITLPAYLLTRIDAYVQNHPEHKSRSGFLAEAALRILQGDCK
ncbi:type II toxin-antitoxin system HicB family antitoxin [Pseudomonas mosselii]|nr:type II toxin-antitoxin system HicB family antitoxin [Pseudomonas mosselii]